MFANCRYAEARTVATAIIAAGCVGGFINASIDESLFGRKSTKTLIRNMRVVKSAAPRARFFLITQPQRRYFREPSREQRSLIFKWFLARRFFDRELY